MIFCYTNAQTSVCIITTLKYRQTYTLCPQIVWEEWWIMVEENIKTGNDSEHVSSLKDRLHQVVDEIDALKDSFSKNTENLGKIKSMLDIGSIEHITTMIEDFEHRIVEAERRQEEASEGARRYGEELEKEKERLIKLWEAYKSQEDELSNTEKKKTALEERLKETETTKKQLEDDLTARVNTLTAKLQENEGKIQQFKDYEKRCEEFDNIRNRLEEDVRNLQNEVTAKDETIQSLREQVDTFKEYEKFAEYKNKFTEISDQYEKEKERLTKLYKLYTETETECNNLKETLKGWQDWFDSNKELFERLFSAAPLPGVTTKKTLAPPKQNKSRKKLRLKK